MPENCDITSATASCGLQIRKHIYGLLLLTLVSLIILSAALIGSAAGLVVVDVLLFTVSLLIALAFICGQRPVFWLYISAALLTSLLDGIRSYLFHGTAFDIATFVTGCGYSLLLAIAIGNLTVNILKERFVTADIIMGSVCVYILLGFFWSIIYMMILTIDPAAYKGITDSSDFALVYFSFNTLTTLGQGDIIPTSRIAQALCSLEAVVGQMFPAVFISRLVSLYVVNELAEKSSQR